MDQADRQTTEPTTIDLHRLVRLATEAGRIALASGAGTHRVERIIVHLCRAFGVVEAHAFVTPTGLMCSVVAPDGRCVSLVNRIEHRTVDLERVSQVSLLGPYFTRKVSTLDDLEATLARIQATPRYGRLATLASCGVTAGFFALLFGGGPIELGLVFVSGCMLRLALDGLDHLRPNSFIATAIGGALAALMAVGGLLLVPGARLDALVIGPVMLLVPGLAITNAVRDAMAGDLVAGLARGLDAFLIAVAIAIGTGGVLQAWVRLSG